MLKKHILICCCLLGLFFPLSAYSEIVGQQLPAFTGSDMNGNPVDLGKIIGTRPIMLVFWASWCADCRKKVQAVNELYKKYNKDMEFIGINIGWKDTEEKAREFIKKYKMPYPNVFDKTGELSKKYQLNRVFSLIIASKRGTVMTQYNDIPEFGDQNIEILNTYVHKKIDMPPEMQAEMAKRLKQRQSSEKK